ncbi:hypothetical protein AMTR_s00192p00024420 [Amborella trichopoda]|uniref:Uncharacterized protein n=1 Tax=Amborella trichopoda TaxID=13333 RepID=U5CYS6_AMBTC|nr:hypothetical protein AMTR_s00192p00024420 [Amborella trichopoda]
MRDLSCTNAVCATQVNCGPPPSFRPIHFVFLSLSRFFSLSRSAIGSTTTAVRQSHGLLSQLPSSSSLLAAPRSLLSVSWLQHHPFSLCRTHNQAATFSAQFTASSLLPFSRFIHPLVLLSL